MKTLEKIKKAGRLLENDKVRRGNKNIALPSLLGLFSGGILNRIGEMSGKFNLPEIFEHTGQGYIFGPIVAADTLLKNTRLAKYSTEISTALGTGYATLEEIVPLFYGNGGQDICDLPMALATGISTYLALKD